MRHGCLDLDLLMKAVPLTLMSQWLLQDACDVYRGLPLRLPFGALNPHDIGPSLDLFRQIMESLVKRKQCHRRMEVHGAVAIDKGVESKHNHQ
jgi:hypothetical protein